MNQNTDVWLSLLRSIVIALCGLLVTKGIVSADDAPVLQTALLTVLPSAVAAGVAWWAARLQTDKGKAATFAKLDTAGQAAVLAHIPDETKLAAVNALSDVQAVIVKDTATDGVATAAHDPALEKVVTSSQATVH